MMRPHVPGKYTKGGMPNFDEGFIGIHRRFIALSHNAAAAKEKLPLKPRASPTPNAPQPKISIYRHVTAPFFKAEESCKDNF